MRSTGVIFFLIIILIAWQADAEPAAVRVTYADGRPYEVIRAFEIDQTFFIPIEDIVRILSLNLEKDEVPTRAVLFDGEIRLEIPLGSDVWLRNGETILVGNVTSLEEGKIVVSIDAFATVIADAFDAKIAWDRDERLLSVGLASPNILDLQVTPNGDRVSIRFTTDGLLKYHFSPIADDRFEILVIGGVLSKKMAFFSETHLVRSIETRQEHQGVRISVTLQKSDLEYMVFPAIDRPGIFAIVKELGLSGIPEPELRPPKPLGREDRLDLQRKKIDMVVIDPGHGGENSGATGPTGLMEKTVNLDIALKLKELLENKGLKVILTRDRDIDLSLKSRIEIANCVGAGLFLSIHCNGHPKPTSSGFEVYFHSLPSDDYEDAMAALGDQEVNPDAVKYGSLDDVEFILWDVAQAEFIGQSSHLAQLVNLELSKKLPIPNRGVKQADFVVLRGMQLPAVLIETAFITNPAEEKMLADPDVQRSIAEAIASAIMRFKQHYGR